ncbi:histone-lysine N-methyltransferase SETMAR [Trichonephila clavipes]|nr:histone-lysine N-methyltransferase SETMAR [Trichonephila clavipes]
MIAEVNALVLDNHRSPVEEIRRSLDISVGTTHTIMRQYLNFRKLSAQWAPHQLTSERHNIQLALSLNHLQRYMEEYGVLSQIVSVDETWSQHFEPESKRQSKQWKRSTSTPSKKPNAVHASSGKVMISCFSLTTKAHCFSRS